MVESGFLGSCLVASLNQEFVLGPKAFSGLLATKPLPMRRDDVLQTIVQICHLLCKFFPKTHFKGFYPFFSRYLFSPFL